MLSLSKPSLPLMRSPSTSSPDSRSDPRHWGNRLGIPIVVKVGAATVSPGLNKMPLRNTVRLEPYSATRREATGGTTLVKGALVSRAPFSFAELAALPP
jgi:hypothetical protein